MGGKPSTDVLLSAESARLPWHLHCSRSQEMCPSGGTLLVTLMPVLGNEHCIMLPVSQRVQPGVYTLITLTRYRDRDALVQQLGPERPLVYQPLVPQILTACYQVVLLPLRDFGMASSGT